MKKQFILAILTLLTSIFLIGCQHTAQGFGQDVQKNTKAVEQTFSN